FGQAPFFVQFGIPGKGFKLVFAVFVKLFGVGQYFVFEQLGDFVLRQNLVEENFCPFVFFLTLSAFQNTIFKRPNQRYFVALFQVFSVNGQSYFVFVLGVAVVQVVFLLQKPVELVLVKNGCSSNLFEKFVF